MSDPENAIVGCVSGIRKRLLCTCLPTRRSFPKEEVLSGMNVDQYFEHLDTQKANVVSVSPGIVARLMGLESLPDKNLAPNDCLLDSFHPRRSADTIYKPSKFDPLPHRQVRRSLSFRDVPIYLQEKDFFLFGPEDIRVKKMHGSEETKHEPSCRKLNQRLGERIKTKKKGRQVLKETVYNENDYMRMLVTGRPIRIATAAEKGDRIKHTGRSQGKIQNHVTVADRITVPKKHAGQYSLTKDRAAHKPEPRCLKPKAYLSDISRERCSNLRCKQQLAFPESKFSTGRCSNRNVKSVNKMKQSCNRRAKLSESVCYFKSERAACKLANEELERLFSRSIDMWKQVNIQETGIEFEAIIFDGLVHELVAELSGLYQNNMG